MIKLKIDNKVVEVEKGTTILKAARKIGIEIPTLCHFEIAPQKFVLKCGNDIEK